MDKRILITSTDSMMIQFLVPHVMNLAENGYEVEIACSEVLGRMAEVKEKVKRIVKKIHIVRLHRSPANLDNLNGYKDLKKIIDEGNYDIIWTNEPVMGVVTRLAAQKARKKGTKVLYMVHGFHFYKGAPKLNWLVFYLIERLMAPKADMICTVNREDYKRAKTFPVKQVEYIHGIGINTERLAIGKEMSDIRRELRLSGDDFIVLSVGELNENKNQKVIIEAIAKLKDPKIHYILCGKGDQLGKLEKRAEDLGIEKSVHFLGYRKDVSSIYLQADVYVMPSYREGLPVSSLEAMHSGLPLVTSNIRGLVDVMKDGVTGYMCRPDDVNGFAERIKKLKDDPSERRKMGGINRVKARKYCTNSTQDEIINILKQGEG